MQATDQPLPVCNRREDESDADVELMLRREPERQPGAEQVAHVDELACITLETRPQGIAGSQVKVGPKEAAAPAGVLDDGHRVRARGLPPGPACRPPGSSIRAGPPG
ncbi:hypothetical protein DL767_011105 [Monosporascus sp. MG133]|nr:hypothetical protein DL767_011105 [Monosporascus sp. MG133]